MTEQERLIDRLFNNPQRKLLNFSIFRGEKPCTAEELCAAINSALDQVENGTGVEGFPETGLKRKTVDEIVAELKQD